MASTTKRGPQDMPPKGGYGPIQIERIPLRSIIGGRVGFSLFMASTVGGLYMYHIKHREVRRNEIEMRSSRLALTPLLLAERDRSMLKYMRRMRDEEADLMKHISTWEVGTFFGEQIYETIDKDTYLEPNIWESVIHSDPAHYLAYIYNFLVL